MGMAAHAAKLGGHLPTAEMRAAAEHLSQLLIPRVRAKSATIVGFKIQDGTEESVSITPEMAGLLLEIMTYVRKGQAITLVPVDNYLTTQQAADILNVSRPFLVKLLEAGELHHHKIGRHRRILANDLFAYRDKRDEDRSKALFDLISSDADLY
jgi:hypothetical protein